MADKNKTHEERRVPQISINRLADYMGSSEQVKRTIIKSCKYRPIAPVIQHADARQIIAEYLCSKERDVDQLRAALDNLENRICDDSFEETTNKHNCDYLRRFIEIMGTLELPVADYTLIDGFPKVTFHGTKVSFHPQTAVSRVNRRNVQRTGALMLRYAKTKALPKEVGLFESAFMFGYLEKHGPREGGKPDRGLCLTLDCCSGEIHHAPGDAIYRFKEMAAVCSAIAERWPAITPPTGAVL